MTLTTVLDALRSYADPALTLVTVTRKDGTVQRYHKRPGEARAITAIRAQNADHPLHGLLQGIDPDYTQALALNVWKGQRQTGRVPKVMRADPALTLRAAGLMYDGGWEGDSVAHLTKHANEGDFRGLARSLSGFNTRLLGEVERTAAGRGDTDIVNLAQRLNRPASEYAHLPVVIAAHHGALAYLAAHGSPSYQEVARRLLAPGGAVAGIGNTADHPNRVNLHIHLSPEHLERVGASGLVRNVGILGASTLGQSEPVGSGDRSDFRQHAVTLSPTRAGTAYSPFPGFTPVAQQERRPGQYGLLLPQVGGK